MCQINTAGSDVVADFTMGIFPDTNIIRHYLSRGKWIEHKVEYAKWFTNYTLQQISQSIYVIDHTPDILLLDSLCDVRHTLFQHRKKKFKALLGNVDFDDVQTKAAFDSDFTFIGLLTPKQSKINLEIISNFFLKKNPWKWGSNVFCLDSLLNSLPPEGLKSLCCCVPHTCKA